MKEKLVYRSFRPWSENQERLELARRLGINVSELINEILEKNLASHLQAKAQQLKNALSAL